MLVVINFVDCAGVPYPLGVPATLEGSINGNEQAYGTIPVNATGGKLLVRGGVTGYTLKITYSIGTDPFVDLISLDDTRPLNTVCDTVQTITITVPARTLTCPNPVLPGGCLLGQIKGYIDMIGEIEHFYPPYTWVQALNGPFGNYRYDTVPFNGIENSGNFILQNILPSSAVNPPAEYYVYGQMIFRTGTQFEWFQTPWVGYGNNGHVVVPCNGLTNPFDLGLLFQISPGFVTGNIHLCGPVDAPATPSVLRWLQRASDFDSGGIPDQADLSSYSSVQANGSSLIPPGGTTTPNLAPRDATSRDRLARSATPMRG
jgi:hypothetical protein